ncbi:conserved putative membrane protein [Kurlavirus BKC-1]|nr:conserved putative membrane protein [Kurlavirus BKC-1]
MCHSLGSSIFFAVFGCLMADGMWYRKHPSWVLFAFYSLMECTQALQHFVVDACGSPSNMFLSYCAFILVVTQPLLWNYYRWSKAATKKERAVFAAMMWLSFAWMVLFSLRLLPRRSSLLKGILYNTLPKHEIMVAAETCTRLGPTHLYWTFPLLDFNGVEMNWGKSKNQELVYLPFHRNIISYFYHIKILAVGKRDSVPFVAVFPG